MTVELFFKALLLGMLNAAPIGPVGLLCLKRNLERDRWPGLCFGFGMASAYGIIAYSVLIGLKAISTFLDDHEAFFQIVGGALLIFVGVRGLRPTPIDRPRDASPASRCFGEFSASFAMTLCNPVPFATFALLLTSLEIFSGRTSFRADLGFAAGVLLGAAVFWSSANEALHRAKKHTTESLFLRLGQGASIILLVFGLVVTSFGIF